LICCWNFSLSSINIPISFSSITWLISFSPMLCFVLVAWPRCTYLHFDLLNLSTNRQNKASQRLWMIKRSFSYMDK
jgi:hypothetical protein